LGIRGNHIAASPHALREDLVHRIYALINQPEAWPDVMQALDALIECKNNLDPHTGVGSILPHVERVNMLLAQLEQLELDRQQSDRILDSMPFSMLVMQSDCRIISINQRARLLLEHVNKKHDLQYLQLRQKQWQASLLGAVKRMMSGHSSSESLHIGHLNLQLSGHGHDNKQLLVLLSEHTVEQHICIETLQQMYGLTGQEAYLTLELIHGSVSLEAAALVLGIRISTARSHLKRVFSKTGTCSQAELAKMILLNPALTILRGKHVQTALDPRLCQLARLVSGRTISWAEYGDPEGSPLLMCHAITGCRLLVPDDMTVLGKHGIRLIVPDRAGYGMSTPATKDTLTQWLDDIRYFIPEIGIEGCDMIGHMAGGVHAKKLAATFPDMVGHLHLVSSTAPLQDKDSLEALLPLFRMVIALSRHSEKAARAVLKLSFKQAIKNPLHYFEQVKAHIPQADHETLAADGLKERLVSAFAETHRQGVDHMLDECLMIANHYHIEAGEIHCRVTTWHGQQDSYAPVAMMDRFEQGLPLLVNRHRIEDAGAYLLFSHWREIIKGIAKARAI